MPKQLSSDQLDKVADICSDIGLFSLASIALPAIVNKFNIWLSLAGVIGAIIFWLLSLKVLNIKTKLWNH